MKLFRFFGQTSRAVLEQVRAELGPDAMIVSNRPTANGIEITAVAAEALATIESAPPAPGSARQAGAGDARRARRPSRGAGSRRPRAIMW